MLVLLRIKATCARISDCAVSESRRRMDATLVTADYELWLLLPCILITAHTGLVPRAGKNELARQMELCRMGVSEDCTSSTVHLESCRDSILVLVEADNKPRLNGRIPLTDLLTVVDGEILGLNRGLEYILRSGTGQTRANFELRVAGPNRYRSLVPCGGGIACFQHGVIISRDGGTSSFLQIPKKNLMSKNSSVPRSVPGKSSVPLPTVRSELGRLLTLPEYTSYK